MDFSSGIRIFKLDYAEPEYDPDCIIVGDWESQDIGCNVPNLLISAGGIYYLRS
jgi:hypothetical protein